VSSDPLSGVIDLNQHLRALEGFSVTAEPQEVVRHRLESARLELENRLKQEDRQNEHKLAKEDAEAKYRRFIFGAVFIVVIVFGAAAGWVALFDDGASAERQTLAGTIASAIVAGMVGYFGGSSGKTST
jgi:hypothetical protein